MKIIFSRKGFDSSTGGFPSPIVNGVPISLPIPGIYPSETTYGHLYRNGLCLGKIAEQVTEGECTAETWCHNDPMFECGRWAFGQVDGAQTHLSGEKTGLSPVDEGDVFLFFGLFAYKNKQNQNYRRDWHHRIFGCMTVEKGGRKSLDSKPDKEQDQPKGFSMPHPHVLTKFADGRNYEWAKNNTLYTGNGHRAQTADDALRLTDPDDKSKNSSCWPMPRWLHDVGLNVNSPGKVTWLDYPKDPQKITLQIKYRWQECVSGDISGHAEARKWLAGIMAAVKGDAAP